MTSTEKQPQPVTLRAASLALLTAVIWGGNPVAASYSLDTLPPLAIAAIRFSMAAVFMFFWCRWERSRLRLESHQLVPVLLTGFGMFAQISLFNIGVLHSNSSHGAMLIPTYIIWVNLLEHFVTKSDRLTLPKVCGLVLATGGVLLILSVTGEGTAADPDSASIGGDLILLLSAIILSVKVIYVKHVLAVIEPGKLIFWHDIVGVFLFVCCSVAFETISPSDFTWEATLALLYQGILVAGLCFAIQALLLRKNSASQIAVFSFATPLCGVIAAVLFRGDALSSWLILSTLCVAVGIWVIQRGPAKT